MVTFSSNKFTTRRRSPVRKAVKNKDNCSQFLRLCFCVVFVVIIAAQLLFGVISASDNPRVHDFTSKFVEGTRTTRSLVPPIRPGSFSLDKSHTADVAVQSALRRHLLPPVLNRQLEQPFVRQRQHVLTKAGTTGNPKDSYLLVKTVEKSVYQVGEAMLPFVPSSTPKLTVSATPSVTPAPPAAPSPATPVPRLMTAPLPSPPLPAPVPNPWPTRNGALSTYLASGRALPVLLLTCRRAQSLRKTLRALLGVRGVDKGQVLVSQVHSRTRDTYDRHTQ
jgi:hypothetical protein